MNTILDFEQEARNEKRDYDADPFGREAATDVPFELSGSAKGLILWRLLKWKIKKPCQLVLFYLVLPCWAVLF